MSIWVVFWMLIFVFGIIGAFRGWVKELLVIFSVILALFLLYISEKYLGFVKPFSEILGNIGADVAFNTLADDIKNTIQVQFWIRTIIIFLLALFGYQTPKLSFIKDKAGREQVQDILFGAILGAVSGFLIIGSLWYYMDQAHYLFAPYISMPIIGDELGDKALNAVKYLPPAIFSSELVLLAIIGISFLFVLVVFI